MTLVVLSAYARPYNSVQGLDSIDLLREVGWIGLLILGLTWGGLILIHFESVENAIKVNIIQLYWNLCLRVLSKVDHWG